MSFPFDTEAPLYDAGVSAYGLLNILSGLRVHSDIIIQFDLIYSIIDQPIIDYVDAGKNIDWSLHYSSL
jgi:hypothetical protein